MQYNINKIIITIYLISVLPSVALCTLTCYVLIYYIIIFMCIVMYMLDEKKNTLIYVQHYITLFILYINIIIII